ncbi:hypothetical protein KY331_03295 [Candidatus Woesearchaeota archaeon]|nr:hypothetical protein [Candidatus Woesearchaeota archaeon]
MDEVLQKKVQDEKKFQDLVKRVQKECGFVYATYRQSEEPYDKTIYNFDGIGIKDHQTYAVCAVRGIHKKGTGREGIYVVEKVSDIERYRNVRAFMEAVAEVDRPVFEVVLHGIFPTEVITPDDNLIKHLVTTNLLYTDQDIKMPIGELTYCAKKGPLPVQSTKEQPAEKDQEIHVITQTLIADEKAIKDLAAGIKEDPNRIPDIFKGVFPKLDSKYHTKRNGKILFLEGNRENCLDSPDMIEREAANYIPMIKTGE